ncbi:hypothetical protein IGI04_004034 [Brassica rapa subsp. trilocularis]|uniref:BTB domain-containing protein n=1 Tax=Brassica rapa subsp. trilocularis TaxID=1813537 RepID=A0ABQ7P046_BRACM|nr:hypothetical protein IGI04_004034 [Brassica rapa subsp. trilocularis]
MDATTESTSHTETLNGTHEFKISGYSLIKGMGVGKYVASETFTLGGYSWAIYFYPDGKSPEDNSVYVSLFIALASEGADVRALFELTLVDQSGNERHKVHSHFGRTLESGPYTLKYRGSMWGYKRFFKRSLLESSDYLKDNCLLVRCCVGLVKSRTEGPRSYNIPVPVSEFGRQFGKVLESGRGADVTFRVDGETFPAHKLVLAARSPVFRAQIFGPLKSRDTECIDIEDMVAPIFKVLLLTLCWFRGFSVYDPGQDRPVDFRGSVMETDGFDYLKESCPCLLSELLEYVARLSEHSLASSGHGKELYVEGCDVNGRRVKQRLH